MSVGPSPEVALPAAHLAPAVLHVVADGPAAGTRVVTVAPAGGLHVRLLADRGLDVGAAWFGGQPIGWTSAVGETRPGFTDAGEGWHRGWAGGLVTTCGLRNVGLPSEGHGRHGTFTDLPARDLRTSWDADGGEVRAVTVSATLVDGDALGPGLVVERQVTAWTGRGDLLVSDVTTNHSAVPLQAPLLYHVNLGHPFVDDGTAVAFGDGALGAPMGPPRAVPDEVVEHRVAALSGVARAHLRSGRLGMAATVSWGADELPRAFTWQRRWPGAYVVAVEPANCGVGGRAADRDEGRAPILEPGRRRHTWVRIELSGADAREGAR